MTKLNYSKAIKDIKNDQDIVSDDLNHNIADTLDVSDDIDSLDDSISELKLSDKQQDVVDNSINSLQKDVHQDDTWDAPDDFNDLMDYVYNIM